MISRPALSRAGAIAAMALVFGVALRPALVLSAAAEAEPTPVIQAERRPVLTAEGFRLAGTFAEPLGQLSGYVVQANSCPEEAGVLPVRASFSAIAPSELRWRDGPYLVTYIYGGAVYDGALTGTAITARNIVWRLLASVHLTKGGDAMRHYHKVWWPEGCTPPTTADLTRLVAGLSG